jgi:hypothetical protein
MTNRRSLVLAIFATLIMVGLSPAAFGQSNENSLANVNSVGSGVRFDVHAPNAGVTLTVTAPDGRSFTKESRGGVEFTLSDKSLPDGVYTYELRLKPALTAGQRESLKAGRGNDDDPEADRAARKRTSTGNMVQSGSFAVMNGQVIVAGLSEGQTAKSNAQPGSVPVSSTNRISSANTAGRLRNHRMSLLANYMFDFVIADDLIVQGSACVGLDCVNGEVFNFDTIRVKENNTRISFNDTSVSAGFPTNDWTIRANSSASGGANFLAFVDRGTNNDGNEGGTIVLEVDAGAPANSVRVDSIGRLGLRTATPVLDVHVNTGNTPAMRYEQNNSGGFTAQTWDIGANEANFFVRDVTSGSRLPFRIRPGAPTSSIDVSASGNVGIGTASPARLLTLNHESDAALGFYINNIERVLLRADSGANLKFETAGNERVRVDGSGNVGIATAAPTATLSVNGTANKPGGGSWDIFSDERLKNIKGNFRSGLKAVMQLTPIRYEYLKNNALGLKSDGEHIGFGARSLQKILPEAVTRNSEGYLMVNNDPIIWTMLNAIKEQQKEIEQLKNEIQKLRRTSHRGRK